MKVEFDKSFLKSIDKIKDAKILQRIEKVILECESATRISEISNVKKLQGFSDYFRIKMGSYRIGFQMHNKSVIRFIIITHRKDIYKKFP